MSAHPCAARHVLITGGTGSFGERAIDRLLEAGVSRLTIYSRDEHKQFQLQRRYERERRLRCLLGDVRDQARLEEALAGVDIVIHAAAMKHVLACEANPAEAVLTNAMGTHSLIRACRRAEVSALINLSADKACLPESVYGATKLLSERIVTEAGVSNGSLLRGASVRYSNVLGSRGSVTSVYQELLRTGQPLRVFDSRMTRLVLTQDQVVDLVFYALAHAVGGEVILKDAPALRIEDLARAMVELHGSGEVIVSEQQAQAGEKYEASLLTESEAERALLTPDGYYVIVPSLPAVDRARYAAGYPGAQVLDAKSRGSATARLLNRGEVQELLAEALRSSTAEMT